MSTLITINKGTQAIARRYYGGKSRGAVVRVFGKCLVSVLEEHGSKIVRSEGCVFHGERMTLRKWINEQRAKGYSFESKDVSVPELRAMV